MGGRTGWKNWINAGARLVLLASGVYGCLLLLRSSDGIACSPWAVYGGTGVLCLLLWLSAGRGKGCVLALSALLLLGSGAALLLFPETIGGQARALAGAFLGQGEGGGTSVTAALFLAGAGLQSSPCWNLSWATTGSSIS